MEIALVVAVIAAIFIFQTFKIVPQQNAWVVERLGRFDRTLTPGLKFVIPFIERVAYKHSLKEVPLDVPSQVCITKHITQLQVDGILFFQVTDPMRASYGSSNYIIAITQLAQTTLRSMVGKMELDKTFEERHGDHRQQQAGAAPRQQGAPAARRGHAGCATSAAGRDRRCSTIGQCIRAATSPSAIEIHHIVS